jgi:hypothetical protein
MSLINFVTGFVLGAYTGLYAVKHNYNVPQVPDPQEIVDYVKKFIEDSSKKPPSGSGSQ